MKNKKSNYILLCVVLIIWLWCIIIFVPFENNSSDINAQENSSLKLSADEITIITPENKTYALPTSGYYPATYGFENDADGNLPNGWIGWPGGIYLKTIAERGGHKKVVEGYTTKTPVQNFGMINDFTNQTSGTIEFWIQSSVGSYFLMLTRDVATTASALTIYQDKFQYYDGTFHEVMPWTANTWYHIKLEIDCESDTYDIYINNVLMKENATFQFNVDKINRFRIYSTTESGYQGYLWVDAIGYSWDPHYNIGDNLEEGLLLSYENSTNLDWMGYSLDNSLNKTIFGNSTFSMPSIGTHSIQVFGNSSLGTMYESEKRYFTMNYAPINLISPDNKTYTEAMSGYYPATYGFENDESETFPKEWINYPATGCSIKVIDESNSHKKIVKLLDEHDPNYALMVNVFRSPRIAGNVEFWISTTDITKRTHISFRDMAGITAFYLEIHEGNLKFWYGDIESRETSISNDAWYHIRVEFDCSEDKVSYWLDGINKLMSEDYYQSVSTMGKIHINTVGADAGYVTYIDAIGYSWYESYNIGDNFDEGILLGFENSSILDWMGYSLDGDSKISILGNTTLSVPEDGVRTIQVFGKDPLQNLHASELIYFTIDMAPLVRWQSPKENQIVKLPPGDAIFEFQYTYRKLDDVRLEINGTDFGSVWNKTSTILTPYTNYTDGYVTAILHGYQGASLITSDSRNFTLSKIDVEVVETLNSSTEILGGQLYMIFHDPHGDNSYSSFSQTSQVSIGVGLEITTEVGMSVEIGEFLDLFGVEVGHHYY